MAAESSYDLIVIGAGPGGYTAAIRAAQLGMKVACVETRPTLGGTCLNVGCIPSKALLESSELYHEAKHGLKAHGVTLGEVGLDLDVLMERKDTVVKKTTDGVAYLFKKNKIDWLVGLGSLGAPGEVVVKGDEGEKTYGAKHILIATGSSPISLPGVKLDGERIVTSDEAIALPGVPEHLVVIGGGVIGLELGSVWARLGSKVTVIEYLPRLMAGMDADLAKEAQKVFKKQGLTFLTGTKVTGATVSGEGEDRRVEVSTEAAKGGDAKRLTCDYLLVCVGRRPHTKGLNAEGAGLQLDKQGRIEIDDHFKTNLDGVYAIGDVVRGAMLAHKAEEEGVACVEGMAGVPGHVNYDAIPSVVYTWPEIASVGKTEDELKEAGVDYRKGRFPFSANARARAMGHIDGWVKILADAKTDRVLGAHIIGPRAGDLIAELVLGIEFGASSEDIARTSHAHPTLAEVVKEAALAVDGRALNM